MIAFSGVRSSCDMFARNSDLCLLAASSSRLFSSSSLSAVASSRVRSSTFCSRPAVGLLEPRRHAIELVGERSQLVAARDLDPLVERAGADLRRRSLDRLDRPDEPPGEQDAGGDRQQQEERPAGTRSPPDRRLEGRERLAQRLLDEDPPAERGRSSGTRSTPSPVVIASDRRPRRRTAAGLRRARLCTCGSDGEARLLQDEVDVGVGDEPAQPVDRVRVAGRADSSALDHVADEPAGRSRRRPPHVQARPRATEIVMCGSRAPAEVDVAEIGSLRPCGDEAGIAPRSRLRCLASSSSNLRDPQRSLPARVEVADLADVRHAVEEAQVVQLPLLQPRRAPSRGGRATPLSWTRIVVQELVDRGGRGTRLLALDPRRARPCCPGTRSTAR